LSAEGTIRAQGTHARLVLDSSLLDAITDSGNKRRASIKQTIKDEHKIEDTFSPGDIHEQIEEQTETLARQTGDWTVYKYYINSFGHGQHFWFWILVTAQTGFFNGMNIWLQRWANDTEVSSIGYYLSVYTVLFFISMVMMAASIWQIATILMQRSSRYLHATQLKALAKAPMSFFSSTDAGQLTTRFGQDMMIVDAELPLALSNLGEDFTNTIEIIIIIAIASPWISVVVPFLLVAFWLIQKFYLSTSRQMRLLDLEAKAPLYTNFLETLSGLATVRAYHWGKDFRQESRKLLHESQKPFYYLTTIQRWLSLVLDLVVAALAVLVVGLAIGLRGKVNASFLGLALVNIVCI